MITKEQAIEIAKNGCQECGWEWVEPIEVKLYRRKKQWGITVGARFLGAWRASILIDQKTGEIIDAGKQIR